MSDSTAPVRRFDIEKRTIVRVLWGAGVAVLLAGLGLFDYVRVRIDQVELDELRVEAAQQREKLSGFEEHIAEMNARVGRLRELERKIRIIANLPGSASSGGIEITEAAEEGPLPDGQGDGQGDGAEMAAEIDAEAPPQAGADASAEAPPEEAGPPDRVSVLRRDLEHLGLLADTREASLLELIEGLEEKHHELASSPAIWPAKGWLTSRFGNRISPFTGRKQFHAGIDIAGAAGTEVVAPARGVVTFAGKRGPLGNSIIIDHGYGVRTLYGHNKELFVQRGQEVQRGQRISALGSTGRSTGPHLHYVVEVNGKARNPLDYIFD